MQYSNNTLLRSGDDAIKYDKLRDALRDSLVAVYALFLLPYVLSSQHQRIQEMCI